MLKSQSFAMKIPWPCCILKNIFSRRFLMILLLVFVIFLPNGRLEKLVTPPSVDLDPALVQKLQPTCPKLLPKLFQDQTPKGHFGSGESSITLTRTKNTSNVNDCIESCCFDVSCQMVFMYKNNTVVNCYHATCIGDESCLPATPDPDKIEKLKGKSSIVLVRTSSKALSWTDVDPSLISVVAVSQNPDPPKIISTAASTATTTSTATSAAVTTTTLTAEAVTFQESVCEVGLDIQDCKPTEECVPVQDKSRNGVCKCKLGFSRNPTGVCSPDLTTLTTTTTTTAPTPQRIIVNVASKDIQLPTNSAKLTAFTVPEEPPNSKFPYNYEWKLISGPPKGTSENSRAQTLTLSNLEEGTYQFKLIVTGGMPPVEGEAFGNVTVLPAKRVNTPPKAIVQPVMQTVNLPTTKAIIDGSGSQDDTPDLKFKWEILNGPVNYQNELPSEPTLTLVDLVAGNYTIQLTVTDSDGATSSTLAHLVVNEEIDYPPSANAGEDIILYLPNNEVDLHGNMSSDDHKIVGWEWTRAPTQPGGKELAADIKDTRTPHPHLSNLEEGVYTFTLKVTDAKGQSDEDQVNVYVKPPISLPPTADAGKSQEISLPLTWVTLDGSASKDDVNISSYAWSQVSGPNEAYLETPNAAKCNATGLTKGKYVFKLTVKDNLDNAAESSVEVVVNQDSNSAPVANAGADVLVTLPKSVVVINGSGSYDDLKIVKYLWTRLPASLAAGKILGTSNTEPALLLVNLVPGVYIFQLQVWDEQGKSSTDKVSIKVKENPEHANVIQAVLNVELTGLTQNRLDGFCQSLSLLLRNDGLASVRVLNLLQQKDTGDDRLAASSTFEFFDMSTKQKFRDDNVIRTQGYAILHFLMEESLTNGTKVTVPGLDAVTALETKLKASQDILDLKVLELDTLECQNTCSGHGRCQQATRTCICEPFWIENFVRRHLMDGKSNCDWSVIYVGIFFAIVVAAVICSVAFIVCKKKKLKLKPRRRYTRLEQNEQNMEMRHAHTSSLMTSESETDSEDDEIIFDDSKRRTRLTTKTASNGFAATSPKKNGFVKLNRESNA